MVGVGHVSAQLIPDVRADSSCRSPLRDVNIRYCAFLCIFEENCLSIVRVGVVDSFARVAPVESLLVFFFLLN